MLNMHHSCSCCCLHPRSHSAQCPHPPCLLPAPCCRLNHPKSTPGDKLELHGLESFDAAVYCASLTAAERLAAAAPSTPEAAPHPAGTATTDTGSQADTNTPQEGKARAPDAARPVVASAAADGTAMAGGFSGPEGPSSRTSGSGSSSSMNRSRASSSSGSSSSLVTACSVDLSVEAAAVGGTGPGSTLQQTWSGASSSSHSGAPHHPMAVSACSNSRRMAAEGGGASSRNRRASSWAAATSAWHWAMAKLMPKGLSAPARAAAAAGQQSAS